MDSSLVLAVSALAGAAIGGAMSFLGTWVVNRRAIRAQWDAHDRLHRQELYKEFIETAATCYADALQCDKPDGGALVILYAKMSRMRVISSFEVFAAAEQLLRRIARVYSEPELNVTTDRLREMLEHESFDALRDFGKACRAESDALRAQHFELMRRPVYNFRQFGRAVHVRSWSWLCKNGLAHACDDRDGSGPEALMKQIPAG